MKQERNIGLLINVLVYLVSFGIAIIPYLYMTKNGQYPIESMFIFTMVATLICYIFTLVFNNTSVYDPYWSVAPFVMSLIHMIRFECYNPNSIIFMVLMFIYSLRLTRNWWITYKGISNKYEDWRYSQYREKGKLIYHIVNFTGFQYVPTIVVYASLVPGLILMSNDTFSPLSLIGFAFMLAGPIISFIADHQVHKFISENPRNKTCNYGLWNYSRHPNYFGELCFWFGIMVAFFLMFPTVWYAGFGYILMVILFFVVSIPMMEKHNMERRNDYADYKKHTSMFFFWPKRK